MRVLFYMRAIRQLRPYKSIITALSNRGHSVRVVFDPREKKKFSTDTVELCKKETPNFDYEFGHRRLDFTRKIVFPARELLSYRRYLLVKGQAEFYKNRWIAFLPRLVQKALKNFP